MADRKYETPTVDREWADSRSTHMAVAVAIHATAGTDRTPEDIWEAPTSAEWDNVTMAVEEYLDHGDFTRESDGQYPWGDETIRIYDDSDDELKAWYEAFEDRRVGGPVGEIYADENCTKTVDDWRDVIRALRDR